MNNQLSINIYLTEKFLERKYYTEPLCLHPCIQLEFHPKRYVCIDCLKFVELGTYIEVGEDARKWFDRHLDTPRNLNLFTPEGFFLLWEKAQREEWWLDFRCKNIFHVSIQLITGRECASFAENAINPLTFPTLLATYLGWKES